MVPTERKGHRDRMALTELMVPTERKGHRDRMALTELMVPTERKGHRDRMELMALTAREYAFLISSPVPDTSIT